MGMTLGEVDSRRLAVGGFSLGGNLVLRAARSATARAFVDFFAPMVSGLDAHSVVTPVMAAALPPTLIHHGKPDAVVPIGDSLALKSWLQSAGVVCEMIFVLPAEPPERATLRAGERHPVPIRSPQRCASWRSG